MYILSLIISEQIYNGAFCIIQQEIQSSLAMSIQELSSFKVHFSFLPTASQIYDNLRTNDHHIMAQHAGM
jgi:hypothetical protein